MLHCPSIILPDDVLYLLDDRLSKHHSSKRRELSVRTFLCVEKIRTILACICSDVIAARPDASQCSTIFGILSKTQIWEDRYNRPDDVDSGSDALTHKASLALKIKLSGRHILWKRQALIWKLRASDQPSGWHILWSRRAKP
jgi:hypothetical protein